MYDRTPMEGKSIQQPTKKKCHASLGLLEHEENQLWKYGGAHPSRSPADGLRIMPRCYSLLTADCLASPRPDDWFLPALR